MKRALKLIAIIAIIALIGFSITCGAGDDKQQQQNQTPTADDYIIGRLNQTVGSVTAVSITPKSGKSTGAITIKYAGSTTIPQTVGSYEITFDVAPTTGWNSANGLSAGTLIINNITFTNIDDFKTWLADQPTNTPNTYYTVAMNLNDNDIDNYLLRAALLTASYSHKFINLDLSSCTINSIPTNAFYNCSCLTSVTIPRSVTSIKEKAFYCCTSLASIIIPDSVTSIGSNAFTNCTSLTSITIPDSVTSSIGEATFLDCTNLTSVTIGNRVTSIGLYAFMRCTSLTNINIPNSITSIESDAFSDCTSLTSITIPNSVTTIASTAFMNCTSISSITIPNSVNYIGAAAFKNCTSLSSVTFEGTITYFYDNETFDVDLHNKYIAGGIGTYTRPTNSSVWTKQ